MGKAYSEFSLSKELSKELETILKSRQAVIDTLYKNLRSETLVLKLKPKQTSEDIQRVARMEEEYYFKQKQFEEQNKTTATEYEGKIWNQINQYVKDYGMAHPYTFILGANGQGNIMYAKDVANITDDVIKYINGRYNGKINK